MPIKINEDSMLLGIDGAVIVMRKAVSRLMAGRPADRGSTIMTVIMILITEEYIVFFRVCVLLVHMFDLPRAVLNGRHDLAADCGRLAGWYLTDSTGAVCAAGSGRTLAVVSCGCRGPILNHSIVISRCAALRPAPGGRVRQVRPLPGGPAGHTAGAALRSTVGGRCGALHLGGTCDS